MLEALLTHLGYSFGPMTVAKAVAGLHRAMADLEAAAAAHYDIHAIHTEAATTAQAVAEAALKEAETALQVKANLAGLLKVPA